MLQDLENTCKLSHFLECSVLSIKHLAVRENQFNEQIIYGFVQYSTKEKPMWQLPLADTIQPKYLKQFCYLKSYNIKNS